MKDDFITLPQIDSDRDDSTPKEQLTRFYNLSIEQSNVFIELFTTIKSLPYCKQLKEDLLTKEIINFKTITIAFEELDSDVLDKVKDMLGASKYTMGKMVRVGFTCPELHCPPVTFHLDFLNELPKRRFENTFCLLTEEPSS